MTAVVRDGRITALYILVLDTLQEKVKITSTDTCSALGRSTLYNNFL